MFRDVKIIDGTEDIPGIAMVDGSNINDAIAEVSRRVLSGEHALFFWDERNDPKLPANRKYKSDKQMLIKRRYQHRDLVDKWDDIHTDGYGDQHKKIGENAAELPLLGFGIRTTQTIKEPGTNFYIIKPCSLSERERIFNDISDLYYSKYTKIPRDLAKHLNGPFSPAIGVTGFIVSEAHGIQATIHGRPFYCDALNQNAPSIRQIMSHHPRPESDWSP